MAAWLGSMLVPVGLTVLEIFLLRYLVCGRERLEREKRTQRMVILLALVAAGVYLRTHRAAITGSLGTELSLYVNMVVMSAFYYAVLIFYLRINRRLSFFYLVVYYIPIDVCDLAVFMFMFHILGIDVGNNMPLAHGVDYLAASFALRFVVLSVIRRVLDRDRQRSLSNMQLFLIAIAMIPYIYMRNLGFWLPLAQEDITFVNLGFLALTGLITLILVIGNDSLVYFQIQRNELLKTQHMIRRQHEQYELRKETVELVNQKYHDLRHELTAILGMEDVAQIHAYVDSLRLQIKPFESFFSTGNQLMDIILNEKAEECRKKNIQLVPTVDGQALSMLEAADLCTIFGNALDNAIESCEQVEEESRRQITLKVYVIQGFLTIHVENPWKQRPQMKGGRMLTTKGDKENHGYGLRGISQVAEKYGGEMETEVTPTKFLLTLLLPLTESPAAS